VELNVGFKIWYIFFIVKIQLYPVFVERLNVSAWRPIIDDSIKGFIIQTCNLEYSLCAFELDFLNIKPFADSDEYIPNVIVIIRLNGFSSQKCN